DRRAGVILDVAPTREPHRERPPPQQAPPPRQELTHDHPADERLRFLDARPPRMRPDERLLHHVLRQLTIPDEHRRVPHERREPHGHELVERHEASLTRCHQEDVTTPRNRTVRTSDRSIFRRPRRNGPASPTPR